MKQMTVDRLTACRINLHLKDNLYFWIQYEQIKKQIFWQKLKDLIQCVATGYTQLKINKMTWFWFLFVLSFNSIAQATEELPETTYKYFTYHTVDKGDTLWSLAEEYIDYNFYNNIHDYVSEVKEINHMIDDTIQVGQTVVIPYFSTIYQ